MLIDYFTRFQQTKIKEKKNNVKYNNNKKIRLNLFDFFLFVLLASTATTAVYRTESEVSSCLFIFSIFI